MTTDPAAPPVADQPDLIDEMMQIGMELMRDMRDQALARKMAALDAAKA